MDNASIILEMLTRIQKLEKQVAELQLIVKSQQRGRMESAIDVSLHDSQKHPDIFSDQRTKQRDKTKYLFNGAVYSKNRLVLAIVKDYTQNNRVSFKELSEAFHPSLQGSLGVVEKVETAPKRQDYQVRFFTAEDDILCLTDGNAYVCNQWGILNIPRFLSRAKELGYHIQEIK